jgi:pantoate--beta-alanine ligase
VDVEELGSILEGEHRPGHFRGVATVCLKLFNLVRPDRAYFGQKDAQQVAVIRRMVRDLAVPVEIRVCPTVRDEAHDLEIAETEGVDVVFAPSADELYPAGFATWVDPGDTGAEGVARPGHFRGVATVCLKLFNLARPERAYFGQKDAQQVAVVRQLVRDLNVPVEIRVVPTVRDPDGLALSSRNGRLSAEERERALGLPRALASAAGEPDPVAAARGSLNGLEPDYVEVLDLGDARILAAAIRVGSTRLIDNVLVEGDLR